MRISILMRKTNGLACLAIAILAWSCTPTTSKNDDPVRVLTDYINKSFSAHSREDKQVMGSYLTGDVKNRLMAWSDEQFDQAFIQSKRKFLKLLIRENKKVSDNEVSITYELSYFDPGKGTDAKVTNRKLAVLVREPAGASGAWLIREVKSIKELIEYQNEIALP